MAQIFLVPGFFGFTKLGAYSYFHRVDEALKTNLKQHGIDAEVVEVDTLPTASIRRRAARLIDFVSEHGGLEQDNLHFIGHSTGGLDIRMMLSPGIQLRSSKQEQEIARRTRTVITLSTPHYGTPMANFFTGISGRKLLLVLCLMATSGPGRYAIYSLARLMQQVAHLDSWLGQRNDILDSVAKNLLSQVRPEEGEEIWQYLRCISEDQGAMLQLTPEAMDLFNSAVVDQSGIDYVSFVSGSPAPSSRLLIPGVRNLYQSLTHLIYAFCYQLTKSEHRHYPYPRLPAEEQHQSEAHLGFSLSPSTNDGIVPTLSQFWGRTGGVYSADHMDVVGQFQHAHLGEHYSTWMMSGSGFNEDRFERMWDDISKAIAKRQRKRKTQTRASKRSTETV